MVIEMQKDASISLIRLLAMLSIVTCHILQYYDNPLCQWFSVGVPLFFLISGFLYGQKDEIDTFPFLFRRFKKILIPYWIFLFVALSIYFTFFPEYLTKLSVIKSLFCVGTVKGLGHLWFVGYILFCYLLLPYLLGLKKWLESESTGIALVIYVSLILFLQVLSYLTHSYFLPDRISGFFIGFFIADLYHRFTPKEKTIFILVICFSTIAINTFRIVLDISIITRYAQLAFGVGVFILLLEFFKQINYCRLFNISDKYSYPIYLVHALFILSPFSLMNLSSVGIFNISIVVIAIVISAYILNELSSFIISQIDSHWGI